MVLSLWNIHPDIPMAASLTSFRSLTQIPFHSEGAPSPTISNVTLSPNTYVWTLKMDINELIYEIETDS